MKPHPRRTPAPGVLWNLGPPERPRQAGEDPALFHDRKGVRLSFAAWQLHTVEWLRWYGVKPKRIERLPRCGTGICVPVCKRCGVEDRNNARRTADCELRICPRCARQTAMQRRAQMRKAFKRLRSVKGAGGWYLHTIPVHYPHDGGTTIARLRYDYTSAWKAWKAAWAFLRERAGAAVAFAAVECAPGGLVHVHALAWHKHQRGQDFKDLRAEILGALKARGHRAEQYHLAKVRKGGDKRDATPDHAIAEVAKYITKGVAAQQYKRNGRIPWQSHPGLSAQIECAWKHRRTWRIYGQKKQIPDKLADKWICQNCGHHHHWLVYELPTPERELAAMVRALAMAAIAAGAFA